jgi:long-chain acyl-CoA synthetase
LASGRALKLPETVFDQAGRALRAASRIAVGRTFVEEALGNLAMVVHGLSPAHVGNVQALGALGVPVVETYGVTAAAGLLSSNTFDAPHLNLIGSPLPHVSFRLGAHSLLEYKLSLPVFQGHGHWQETGDVAQMTPFGFAIAGRKKHLYTTAGGVTVSPVRLEQTLKEKSNDIADVCLVGDRMPFLSALVVLTPESDADHRSHPEVVKGRVQAAIDALNENLPRHATVKKFAILEKPFREQEGERLPSGGLNRLRIFESRAPLIEALYQTT